MKALFLSLLLVFVSISTAANAKGFYSGLVVDSQNLDFPTDARFNLLGVVGGYQFNDYLSVEGRLSTGLNDETLNVIVSEGPGELSREIDFQASVFLKGSYEIANGLSIYALTGYSDTTLESTLLFEQDSVAVSNTSDASVNGFAYGVGLNFEFSSFFQMSLEYREMPDLDFDVVVNSQLEERSIEWDALSLAVSYKF